MPGLIDELKDEHRKLLKQIEEARAVNLDGEALRRSVAGIKSALLAHLGKEDARFYPALAKAAQRDARLNAILSLFQEDLAKVAQQATAFFARAVEADPAGELAHLFSDLAGKLRSRISKEENLLYPEFERLGLG